MFELSGLRGQYPQVFIQSGEEVTFIGNAEKINELLDCDDLPEEVKKANPDIPTFNKVFAAFR